MSFDIKELTVILAIGFFFIGMLELFIHQLFGRTVFPYQAAQGTFPPLGMIGLVLAIVLLLGMCIDSFSKRWVARTSTPPSWAIPAPAWLLPDLWQSTYEGERNQLKSRMEASKHGCGEVANAVRDTSSGNPDDPVITQVLLPPEKELRAHPLFNPFERGARNGAATDQLIDLLKAKIFGRTGGIPGAKIQNIFDSLNSDEQADTATVTRALKDVPLDTRLKACSIVYYIAKNRVYQQPQYYAELQSLQTRIDFARSMSLCFYALVWFMAALYAVRITLAICGLVLAGAFGHTARQRLFMPFHKWNHSTTILNVAGSIALFTASIVGIALSRETFLSNEHAYNGRIYGYFESLESDNAVSWAGWFRGVFQQQHGSSVPTTKPGHETLHDQVDG